MDNILIKNDSLHDTVSKSFLLKYHHDIREPLRNISNFLQIIKIDLHSNPLYNSEHNSDLIYYINNAINCLSILDDLNNSLINFNYDYDKKVYKLNSIINKIVCLLSNQLIRRKGVINTEDNIPSLECSTIDIFRIFKNLIENAIQYTICDKLIINISCINKVNNKVVLLFEDNGEKLSKETIIKIKSILNGKENINNNMENIGLQIVKELIKKNNGNITLLENHCGCSYEIVFKSL